MSHQRMIMTESFVVVLLASLIITTTKAINISPTAQTQQGIYIGYQTTTNGTNVNFWLGIPYAQQPVGNLRWMPPRALAISNGTRDAYIPNSCYQLYGFGTLPTEACLTLNVYAPENATNLPVFVWIHGGSFSFGFGTQYNATPFVSTGIINSLPVVVVTINYRLGLFGFLADEGLYNERSGINNRSTTGNYAILDQIMALDWIKKNIAGFGGNPEQITVGGESAGGISMTVLLTSSLVADGTFQRAIVQSGSIWPNLVGVLETAINSTGNVLRATTQCTTVQCLRNLTADQILAVQANMMSGDLRKVIVYPVIDGYVLNDTLENYYAKGDFQKVPIIIGSTANESTLFVCPIFNDTANSTQVQAYLKTLYNDTIISKIPTIYGPISAYSNPLSYLNTVYTDSWIHCGARRIASKFSSYGSSSYLFTYNYLLSAASACQGATHSSELPMLFPSYITYLYRGYNFNALDQQFSTNMTLYWINFIYKSNPSYNGNSANWDAYTTSSDNDFVLDINLHMRNHYYNATCSGLWDLYAVTNSAVTSFTTHTTANTSILFWFFLMFAFDVLTDLNF